MGFGDPTYTPDEVARMQNLFAIRPEPTNEPTGLAAYGIPQGPPAAFPNAAPPPPAPVGLEETLGAANAGRPLPVPPSTPSGLQQPSIPQEQADAARGLFAAPPPGEQVGAPVVKRGGKPPVDEAPMARSGGGGGSSGSNLGTLGKQAADDRKAYLSSFDTEGEAKAAEARAIATKNTLLGDEQQEAARRQEEDAAIQRASYRQMEDVHAKYLAKSQEMTDELSKKKAKLGDFFADKSTAEKVAFAIGGVLGAFLQGLQGSKSNEFVDTVNRLAEQRLQEQKAELEEGKASLALRNSQYAQMREQFGDVKLADQQYRISALTATENHLKAMASQLDNPAVKARADEAIGQLQQQKAAHQAEFSQEALAKAQAQAAASAAAAQRAAAARQEMYFKLREENRKDAELEIKGREADAKGGEKTAVMTAEYAKELEKAGIPKAEAQIQALKRGLPKPGQDIPGLGVGADIVSKLPGGERWGLDANERVNRNNVAQLALAYRNAVTGSGGSVEEAKQIEQAFYGSRTTEELWAAIAKGDAVVDSQKRNLQKGYGPEVVNRYNANAAENPGVSSFTPGLKR